ncbi:MAG: DUF4258 domain-containing protein [Gemmataceae bacterium]|nr:DUF4258 domain-containing protein [Gemmataceae bacterium]
MLSNADNGTKLTRHAADRMAHRSISSEVIESVIEFGRVVFTRGAMIYAIGRKEVERYRQEDIDLSDCEGVQVVCSTEGTILTVYRNHSFRGLRPGLGRGRNRPAGRSPRCSITVASCTRAGPSSTPSGARRSRSTPATAWT